MSDATQRSLRTLYQSLLAIIAGGGVIAIWNTYADGRQIDPTIGAVVTIIVGPTLVSWATNELEDRGIIKTRLKEPATEAAEAKTLG